MSTIVALFFLLLSPLQTIGVMGAMEVELELICREMVVEKSDTIGDNVYWLGRLHSVPCVMVRSGVGKVGAAQTAQSLIMEYDVDAVIFTGVAGGINPELNIGDIVIYRFGFHPSCFVPIYEYISHSKDICPLRIFEVVCNMHIDVVSAKNGFIVCKVC